MTKTFLHKIRELSNEERIILIRKTTCLFFGLGILMSYKLWTSEHLFPMLPFLDLVPQIGSPFDIILFISVLVILILGVINGKQKIFIVLFGLMIFLLLQDQMRWQPWVYLYLLILFPFLKSKTNEISDKLINYFQIILIGVYVWSGVHKLNPNFITFTFHDILTKLLNIENSTALNEISSIGYSLPIMEIFIGLCLVIPRYRNLGVYLAILTHIFVLIYLSPLGLNYNSIVYPWNIAMIVVVFLTFYNTTQKLILWQKRTIGIRILTLLAILFIWILPALNMVNKWDHYLSFSLYSDKPNNFFIAIAKDGIRELPEVYYPYFAEIEGMTNVKIIDVNKWTMEELKVPFYPETRVFKKLGKSFCNIGIEENQLMFIEYEKPLSNRIFYTFQCKDLVQD